MIQLYNGVRIIITILMVLHSILGLVKVTDNLSEKWIYLFGSETGLCCACPDSFTTEHVLGKLQSSKLQQLLN